MTLNSGDVLVYDGNNWVNSSYTSYTKVSLLQPAPSTGGNGLLNLGSGGFGGGAAPNFVGNASGTLLAGNAAAGFTGALADLQLAGISLFAVGASTPTVASITQCAAFDLVAAGTASTGFFYGLQLSRRTAGNAGSGFGTGIQFLGQNSTGTVLEIGDIQCVETAASPIYSYLSFSMVMNGTEAEILRLRPVGTAPGQVWCKGDFFHNPTPGPGSLGFFGVGPVARQTGGALTAGAAYGANEQSMLNKAYAALQAYGLLT